MASIRKSNKNKEYIKLLQWDLLLHVLSLKTNKTLKYDTHLPTTSYATQIKTWISPLNSTIPNVKKTWANKKGGPDRNGICTICDEEILPHNLWLFLFQRSKCEMQGGRTGFSFSAWGRELMEEGGVEYCMHHEYQCSMRVASSLFEVGVSPASPTYLRLNWPIFKSAKLDSKQS